MINYICNSKLILQKNLLHELSFMPKTELSIQLKEPNKLISSELNPESLRKLIRFILILINLDEKIEAHFDITDS